MVLLTKLDAHDPRLWKLRAEGYNKLSWAQDHSLGSHNVQTMSLGGDEIVLDAGTGTQIVTKRVLPFVPSGHVLAMDASPDMVAAGMNGHSQNVETFLGDVHSIPLHDCSVDRIIMRMVAHHLQDIELAINECKRVLKPGGLLVICEYVLPNEESREFEQGVFDLKEKGRLLVTWQELYMIVRAAWTIGEIRPQDSQIQVLHHVVPFVSTYNWIGNSGLPDDVQHGIYSYIRLAPNSVRKAMNIIELPDGDTLVHRPFTSILARK